MNTTRTRAAVTASLLAVTSVVASCSAADGTSSSADACGYAFVMQDPMTGSTAEQTIKRGLDRAADELGVEIDVTDGTGIAGVADNLRAAAAKGCYDAIGVPFFANGDAVTQVAAEYPDQAFYIAGGIASGPNVTSFNAANEEGTYVAGAMAAAMTESGTIGVIIGDESPTLLRYSDGFAAGAASVDPSVEVITTAVGSFTTRPRPAPLRPARHRRAPTSSTAPPARTCRSTPSVRRRSTARSRRTSPTGPPSGTPSRRWPSSPRRPRTTSTSPSSPRTPTARSRAARPVSWG